jgi:hypothetical protein
MEFFIPAKELLLYPSQVKGPWVLARCGERRVGLVEKENCHLLFHDTSKSVFSA